MGKFNLNNSYKAIVIGGSAGSFHRLKHVRHGFVEALSIKSVVQVTEPYDKESIKKGGVYLAPANYHLSVELGHNFALSTEEMVNNSRPAIDITLGSCAYVYKEKLIGILLSGANRDGAKGMKSIKEKRGLTIVQEPSECMIETMPRAALSATAIDYVLKVDQIIEFFQELDSQYR